MKLVKFCMRGALILTLLVLSGCYSAPSVSITFGGDIALARSGKALFAQTNPWQQVSGAILLQQNGSGQTFFFANLESPVKTDAVSFMDDKSKGYDLCADVDQLSLLKQGGMTLVNLANNHINDCGMDSAANTRILVEKAGLDVVGPDLTPVFLETQAGKIGLLAAEDVTQPLDENKLLEAVKNIRANCNILIVSLHWGNEYQSGVSTRQEQLAHDLANAGVDVLWGTHPHVLQKMDWISSQQGGHQMLAMYSLGNLLMDQWMTDQTQQSVLVTLQIQEKKIKKLSILPLKMDRTNLQLLLPDEREMQKIEAQLGVNELSGNGVSITLPGN